MTEARRPSIKTKYVLKSILFCILFIGFFIVFSFLKFLSPEKWERLVHGIIGTIAAFFTTYLFLRFDKKSFADIGLKFGKATLKKFIIGIFLGMGIMGLLSMSVIYFSGFKTETNSNSNILSFLFWTLPLIPLAFMEEVGFRAYPLQILMDKVGIRSSIIITSTLFALYHIVNGWTIANSFLGAGVWGIVYGLAAVYSNGISMPTGLHYAANLTTSAFGVTSDSFNIWILKQKDGSTLANYQGSKLTTLIPQVSLLIFAIVCVELVLRN